MNLPTAFDCERVKGELTRADSENQKKKQQYVPPRFIMTDTNDGKQYAVTLTSGALVFTLL